LVEHVLGKDEVSGSIPLMGSIKVKVRINIEGETEKEYAYGKRII
jgi:hypothetical protein